MTKRRWLLAGVLLPGINVHSGFDRSLQECLPWILQRLDKKRPTWVTGHSLGGAVAALLVATLDHRGFNNVFGITFGQPKITDAYGADKFAHLKILRWGARARYSGWRRLYHLRSGNGWQVSRSPARRTRWPCTRRGHSALKSRTRRRPHPSQATQDPQRRRSHQPRLSEGRRQRHHPPN